MTRLEIIAQASSDQIRKTKISWSNFLKGKSIINTIKYLL